MKKTAAMLMISGLFGLESFCHAGDDFFPVPDFKELPPDIQVVSEKTDAGVKVTEMYFAGAPFNGKPTKIYGFYCRPEKDGKYPGVLEIHGAGLQKLGPESGIEYARNGFCCFVMDWAGPAPKRVEAGVQHSKFEAVGNMARPLPEAEKSKAPPHGWKSFGPEVDGIRNGVMFARRAAMLLKSKPEVDADRLCVAGMSAGAHLALLILGVEPSFKAGAVKYGRAFIRDLYFGGYFGPMVMCSREEQDAWLAVLDPKHNIGKYKASVLILSGTDDIFFWMPGVLATYRAIPADKRLLMLPNDNHSQVGNVPIPLSYFKSVLGMSPAWPTVARPTAKIDGSKAVLSVEVTGPTKIAKGSFWVKRMPKAIFDFGPGRKDKPETQVKWIEVPAAAKGSAWTAEIPSPAADEQVVAYAMAEDEGGVKDSSDTVELPDYPQWRGLAVFEPWEQKFKAADFKTCELANPAMADKVRKSGNLRGLAKDEKGGYATGWYQYELWVPRNGWYELLVPGGHGVEYFIDRTNVFNTEGDKVGTFWLEQGLRHTIRLQRYHWTGMPAVEGFTVKAVAPDNLAGQIRATVAEDRTIIRKGEPLRLMIETASLAAPAELGVTVMENQKPLEEKKVVLPNFPGLTQISLELPCGKEGAFTVSFTLNGKPVDKKDLRPVSFNVIDTARQQSLGGEIKRKLIREIDCAAAEPEFTCGETRVVRGASGAYRESGDKGYLAHMNSTEPTWFAYKVEVPEKQKLYQIEVDYPDDALRTYVIAVREASADAYPTAGGVDCGGEFALSNQMLTHSIMHWARTTDLRILVIPALDRRRAAAAKIRVYQVDDDLPLLETPAAGGRHFGNWYEEGSNFVSMYGPPDRSMSGMLTAADRWARTIRYMGGDTLWMTMVVYQFGLYPTKYNVNFGGPYSPDLVRAVIMNCEKYGMGFIGEFHPEARELAWPVNADPAKLHLATNRNGSIKSNATEPIYNPLWPKNQEWYLGMIGEFVDRYKDSPALKGVCLRLMSWCNPGLNNFHSLDWGYDDYTIGLFEKETGRKIPVDAGDTNRFRKRYDWLMANAKAEWIDWRCAKITELYAKIAARVRQAKPDLLVLSNYSLSDEMEDPREAGIDPIKLQMIPGVVLVSGAGYGRRQGDEMAVQKGRDELLDPTAMKRFAAPDGRGSFLDGASYFEATEVVATPEALGFPKDTKRTWMSGVVNPAGRHANERWAVQLAETDTAFIADGGNAYTVGQPVLREFLREYRALPDAAFSKFAGATDPVAVWFSGGAKSNQSDRPDQSDLSDQSKKYFLFYAVNRERYPVKVQIAVKNTDKVERLATKELVPLKDGILSFDLKPYELVTFKAAIGAEIASVKVEVPETDRRHAENLVSFLGKLATDAKAGKLGVALRPDELKLLEASATCAKTEFDKGHFWRVRTMAEHRSLRLIYNRCKQQPPKLRETGAPVPSVGAFAPDELLKRLVKGRAELGKPDEIWPGETLLTSKDPELEFELDIPFDAMTGIELAIVAGGGFGPLELSIDGKSAGILKSTAEAASPRPALARLDGVVKMRQGKVRLSLKRLSGDQTAIRFVAISPVFTDIVSGNWMAAGPFIVGDAGDKDSGAKVDAAMREKNWRPPEVNRDPAAVYEVADGVKRGWVKLDGTSDFINLGRLFDRYFGTISYGITYIHSSSETHVRLLYGMDYWMKIWINGELVKDVETHGGAPFKGQFQVDVPLKAGANELLVKVAAGSLGSGFWMEVSDPGDLRFSQSSK
ncbi:MAG: acetylxylan esterase [Victivallales bacterium]